VLDAATALVAVARSFSVPGVTVATSIVDPTVLVSPGAPRLATPSCQLASLEPETAQAVIAERAGVMAAGTIRRSPLGYLRALITRTQAGDFAPRFAEVVAEFRDRQNITP